METTIRTNDLRTPENKERLIWPDVVKFFAMVLVVVGHVIQKFVPSMMDTPFYNYIWLTQMPLFMLVSGFFTDSRKGLNFREFVQALYKNILTLLVPTFSFVFIVTIVFQENSGNVFETALQFFKNPESNLWFLWVLFLILLIFNIGRLFVKGDKVVNIMIPFIVSFAFFVALLLYLFLTNFKYGNFLGIKLLTYYLPIFCIGSLARLLSSIKWTKKAAFKIPLFFVSITFALFMIFYFKEMRVMANLGRYSLETYYLHIMFLRYLPIEKISSEQVFTQILSITQIVALLLVFTFLVILFTRFVPLIHLIVFGRPNSIYKFEKDFYKRIVSGHFKKAPKTVNDK